MELHLSDILADPELGLKLLDRATGGDRGPRFRSSITMAEAERRLAAFGIRAAAVADQLIVHRNTVRYRWSRSSG